ncbi:MAG: sigma-70 family RNA polymerase sigma factor [Leptolyngbyaceae cyanobacterium CRU_2_3]|nr:sigma-70 family RNA polymerase sigma factor [Leptolyngbyaceae cyanobacterium CRU_2_3]
MEFPSAPDDVSLLARIANCDQTALSALYDRYARIIYSVAFKSLRSVEESEEVVLDVFAQVWRIADRYDASKGRADSWLFMLARSRILDRLRQIRRHVPALPTANLIAEIQISSSSGDPIEDALISERRDRVLLVLNTLPHEQRLVIELAYYQGLTHSQIASQTGISLGTVKTRIRLGLSKLKIVLDAEK